MASGGDFCYVDLGTNPGRKTRIFCSVWLAEIGDGMIIYVKRLRLVKPQIIF